MMRQSKWEKREVQRLKQLQQQLLNLTRAGGEDRKEDADEIHDETRVPLGQRGGPGIGHGQPSLESTIDGAGLEGRHGGIYSSMPERRVLPMESLSRSVDLSGIEAAYFGAKTPLVGSSPEHGSLSNAASIIKRLQQYSSEKASLLLLPLQDRAEAKDGGKAP